MLLFGQATFSSRWAFSSSMLLFGQGTFSSRGRSRVQQSLASAVDGPRVPLWPGETWALVASRPSAAPAAAEQLGIYGTAGLFVAGRDLGPLWQVARQQLQRQQSSLGPLALRVSTWPGETWALCGKSPDSSLAAAWDLVALRVPLWPGETWALAASRLTAAAAAAAVMMPFCARHHRLLWLRWPCHTWKFSAMPHWHWSVARSATGAVRCLLRCCSC